MNNQVSRTIKKKFLFAIFMLFLFVLIALVMTVCIDYERIEFLLAEDFFKEDMLKIPIYESRGYYDGVGTRFDTGWTIDELYKELSEIGISSGSYSFQLIEKDHILVKKDVKGTIYHYIITSRKDLDSNKNPYFLHNMGIDIIHPYDGTKNVSIIFPYHLFDSTMDLHRSSNITNGFHIENSKAQFFFLDFYKSIGKYQIIESYNSFSVAEINSSTKEADWLVIFNFEDGLRITTQIY